MLGEDDDEDLAVYGTPLEPLDEENARAPKAPRIEDQIVTDDKGRRRFHGAFTGGFSAGFFNSVGSKEGWTPSTFVSSRSKKTEKSALPSRNPQDFMDEEDMRDHGIAPQGIRATEGFDSRQTGTKRKKDMEVESSGPIPGKPVLEDLLRPARFNYQTMPPHDVETRTDDSDPESDEDYEEFTKGGFAPDDVETSLMSTPKSDFFGLGYRPLDRSNVLGFFDPPSQCGLKVKEKSKNVYIKGHAFGVGAFEEDDADIYEKDDMSNYDFSLGATERESRNNRKSYSKHYDLGNLRGILEGFSLSSTPLEKSKIYYLPEIPKDFSPFHRPRRRRFEKKESESLGLGRHELSTEDRRRIISPSSTIVEIRTGIKEDKPKVPDHDISLEKTALSGEFTTKEVGGKFKPFSSYPEKEKRYENYLHFRERGIKDKFHTVQLKTMTEWERENELREFERAASLYAPLTATMAARFTSGTFHECQTDMKDGLNYPTKQSFSTSSKIPIFAKEGEMDDKMKAAKSRMFGHLTQTKVDWHPDKILCKRFNVPNPYPDSTTVGVPHAKRERVSIFNFLSAPLQQTAGLQSSSEPIRSQSSNKIKSIQPIRLEDSSEKTQEFIDDDTNSDFVEENYGLKESTTGPPTMDLFKAIFDNDSSDSENDDDKESKKRGPPPPSERGWGRQLQESKKDPTPISGVGRTDRQESKNMDKDKIGKESKNRQNTYKNTSEERIFTRTSRFSDIDRSNDENIDKNNKFNISSNLKATGVFKDIDFVVLNEYRNNEFTATKREDNETTILSRKDNNTQKPIDEEPKEIISEKISFEVEEYGPAPPPPPSTSSSSTRSKSPKLRFPSYGKEPLKSESLWTEKKSSKKKSKKSKKKKKKHKKEKHKSSKKHRRSSSSSSSSSS